MKAYEFSEKKFLNNMPSEYGSICWDVRGDINEDKGGKPYLSGDIRLADCYKSINLDFWCKKPAHFKDRLNKIDTLIGSLLEFRRAYTEARYKAIEAALKYRKEKKGERFSSKKTEKVRQDRLSRLAEDICV